MSDEQHRKSWMPARLPNPCGGLRPLFLVCWGAIFLAAVASSIAVLPRIVHLASAPLSPAAMFGLHPVHRGDAMTLSLVFGPARRAGLQPGDRLISVAGNPVDLTEAAVNRQFASAGHGPVAIVTRSIAGGLVEHIVERDPDAASRELETSGLTPMTFGLLTSFLIYGAETVPMIICAALLMARRSRDPLAPWASSMMLMMVLGNGYTEQWFAGLFPAPWLAYYITNSLAYSLLNVVLAVFPTGRFEPRWSLWAALLGVAGVIISEPMPSQVSNGVLVLTMFIAIIAVLIRYSYMSAGIGRQQIRWALLGFTASMLCLALTALSQTVRARTADSGVFAWSTVGASLFGAGFESLLIIAMTVALMRYRLYGADATISRSVTYGALTLGLLAIFAASEKLFEITGEHLFGDKLGAVAGAIGAAAAAITIVPLHHRINRWAERRFRSGLAHLRQGLPLLVGDLRETASPQILADTMLARVEAGVRASHGAIVAEGIVLDVRDIEPACVASWLTRTSLPSHEGLFIDRADPQFPMRVSLAADGIGQVGWLLLGPRPDGTLYGREEKAALREIADPVARALMIAATRERREAERLRDLVELRQEVVALRQLIGLRREDLALAPDT